MSLTFRNRLPRRALLPAALLSSLALVASPAFAEAAADASDAKTLDRVSVRAEQSAPPSSTTRLPITLQETPQSATAISLKRLQDESLFSINDVMRNVTRNTTPPSTTASK